MSIKFENKVMPEEDVESGQCSEDEVRLVKSEKKSKKKKSRKSRKRRHSSSSSSGDTPSDFFNPYSVNPERLVFKAECTVSIEGGQEEDVCGEEVIAETFKNLSNTEQDSPPPPPASNEEALVVTERAGVAKDTHKEWQMQQMKQRRQARYFLDVTGIDSVSSDLYHYLAGLGLSSFLVEDLIKVMSMEEEENEMEQDEDDGYEEQMINDIPIIDQSQQNEQTFNGGYSPEHVGDIVEPYKPQNNTVAYAPQQTKKNEQPIQIIDPFSIPAVGPRDPRLINTKTLLQSKSVSINKPPESIPEKPFINADITPAMTMEWETTVTNVVKTHLTLYLTHNDINKEEYKSILKRAVNKILMCGERKLETDKISKFVHSYVTMTQKSRVMNNV